ncbi:MAG: ABC transporter permease [Bacteroidetes bacterium GWF2_42_66]|nr:MAG: ABC transporter permease [Bacteroidetes bacterium GWA2_42_15]OFY01472.1 MAG: ABC transporter permease [Bacteroidetes bacterium GWE2_42_39]OFY43347.1 MAG: ABC transporter permease [Bacteroidetes bacterium GWF2_42_66]HBL77470.1 ABC transporter permease [Prolixibacteraceae bacterium]HCR91304.1 ABC transporter permease [Prolixibacteraceae bacterium]
MNTELFIARRIFSSGEESQQLSQRIIRLALLSIALGLVVMILSVAIVSGYKKEISDKVFGFGSHLQIVNFDTNQSYATEPISQNQPFLEELKNLGGIKHVQSFSTKPGLIKTDDEVQAINLKGVAADFDWEFFRENRVDGEIIDVSDSVPSKSIWISQQIASMLRLKLGDEILMFFINEKERIPRNRIFTISGIFQTGLEEFDKMFALVDMRHIQRLNNWESDEISGFEIMLDDISTIGLHEMQVRDMVVNHMVENAPILKVVNIIAKYPQMFDWLRLLDMNVWVLLSLIVVVAGFNMVSSLLVIILERTRMIGILKSLGQPDWSIRKVFLYLSGMLISRALVWGNLLGIVLCLLQQHFHIIQLDPATYYVSAVPINFSLFHLFLLNIGTIIVTILMLIVPTWFITRISPEKTVRFD